MNPSTWTDSATSAAFAALARLRRARAFHPSGFLVRGRLEPVANPFVDSGQPAVDVVGRVSKGIGTPGVLPDVLGIALRSPDWDLLLSTSGTGSVSRCLPLPTTTWTGATFGSIQPFRLQDAHVWVHARLTGPRALRPSLAAAHGAIAAGEVRVLLWAASRGTRARLGEVTLSPAAAGTPEPRFDPVGRPFLAGGLGPGPLTAVRDAAYQGSRRGAPRV